MNGGPVNIVILGTGTAAAMAAAALAIELPRPDFQLTVVPSGDDDDSPFGPIEASDPSIRRFHDRIGIADADLVRAAGASFGLGVAYAGWSRRRPAYFSPFGDIGAAIDGAQFHQLIARLRSEGRDLRASDYSMATLLAQAGRFCQPSNDPASPLSTFTYGLHVERNSYARILLDLARNNGAATVDRGFKRVETDGRLIEAIILEGGDRLSADFVIDASSSGSAIAALDAGWESWRQWLPCDRAIHLSVADPTTPSPYALIEAHPAGWRRTVPCQDRIGEALVYASDWLDQTGAELMVTRGGASVRLQHSKVESGRRQAPWTGNCLAIGSAAAVLEPLYPGSLALIQNSIERLLRLFPARPAAVVEAREYNRETIAELDRARDFALLRYLLNDRNGESFWDQARQIAPPPELQRKLDAYRSRGMVPLVDGDMIDEQDWALIFDEHGILPRRHDVLANSITTERLTGLLDRMRQRLIAEAAAQPLHRDHLAELRQRAAA